MSLYTKISIQKCRTKVVHKCRTKLYTSVVLALYTNVSVHNCLPPLVTPVKIRTSDNANKFRRSPYHGVRTNESQV